MKVLCVSNAPIPYHTPTLNELAQLVDLHVLYMSKDHRAAPFRDPWGVEPRFAYSFHRSMSFVSTRLDMRVQVSVGASVRMRRINPDAVVVISWHPIAYEPAIWARRHGCPCVMWSESTAFSGLLRGSISSALRRDLVRRMGGFVASGTLAAQYLQALGADRDLIVVSRLPAGVTPPGFLPGTPAMSRPSFLFVGRLIPRKRPLELLDAFAAVQRELPSATVCVVGTGPLEDSVRNRALSLKGVRVVGHKEGSELSALYKASDVLVLPAVREVWGLVVNEALGHGAAIVASDQVAAAHDLVQDAWAGEIYPSEDAGALASAMINAGRRAFADNEETRLKRARIAQECTPRRFATDLRTALMRAMSSTAGSTGSLQGVEA
jgi:glycosyltransferase involved in cell wall biosynthesis